MFGRVLVAHPSDVASADQAAAALGRDVAVHLNPHVPAGSVYVIDPPVIYEDLLDAMARYFDGGLSGNR
jgi:hypothetical protein